MKKKYKKIPTLKQNPEFWEQQGKRKIVRILYYLDSKRKCIMCNFKLKEAPVKKYNKSIGILSMFSSEFLFHLKSSHGFEPEIFESLVLSD